jgi:hypothetical protein
MAVGHGGYIDTEAEITLPANWEQLLAEAREADPAGG